MKYLILALLLSSCATWKSADDLMRDSYFEGCMDSLYPRYPDPRTRCADMTERFDPSSVMEHPVRERYVR
jgi:hypothetical protein